MSDERDTELARRKRAMREEAKTRRAALDAEKRSQHAGQAAAHLMSSSRWRAARSVALYCSMGNEIDTAPLARAIWALGREVGLPVAPPLGSPLEFRWVAEDTPMVRSRYGALEPGPSAKPAALSEFDLVVVPGLAFDERGGRLGYGGGYYDRTLALADAPAVLFCFACQQVECVPQGEWDRTVDAVVTEAGWVVG